MPGGDVDPEDAASDRKTDPEFMYKPVWGVQDDELEDVVHRKSDAKLHANYKQLTSKKEVLGDSFEGPCQSLCSG